MERTESNYLDWVAKADSDLLNIENNLASRRYPGILSASTPSRSWRRCFKAFIVHRGGIPPRTHDLVALLPCACLRLLGGIAEEQCRTLSITLLARAYPDDLRTSARAKGSNSWLPAGISVLRCWIGFPSHDP